MQIKWDDESATAKIPIGKDVRQGDTISPKLFKAAMEVIFKQLPWNKKGVCMDGKYLYHLRFADDIALSTSDITELQDILCQRSKTSVQVGLKMNLAKTKLPSHYINKITIDGQVIEKINR